MIALKGGSGKTTVATHLALAGALRGLSVRVADIDPQRSAHDILSAREAAGPDCVTAVGRNVVAAQFGALSDQRDLFIIDTAAGAVEDAGEAVVAADFVVMVARPTLIDLSGLARTITLVRKLGKPHAVVVNQAPVARETVEAPLVKRALRGLEFMQAPVAPVIVRARSIYQTALERGCSAEESPDKAAAAEIAALWDFIDARTLVRKSA